MMTMMMVTMMIAMMMMVVVVVVVAVVIEYRTYQSESLLKPNSVAARRM